MKKVLITLTVALVAALAGHAQTSVRSLEVNGAVTTLSAGSTYRFAETDPGKLAFYNGNSLIQTDNMPVVINFKTEATGDNPFGITTPTKYAIKYNSVSNMYTVGSSEPMMSISSVQCMTYDYTGSAPRYRNDNIMSMMGMNLSSITIVDGIARTAKNYTGITGTWTDSPFTDDLIADDPGSGVNYNQFTEITKIGEKTILGTVCEGYRIKYNTTDENGATVEGQMESWISRELGLALEITTEADVVEDGVAMHVVVTMTATKYTFDVPESAFSTSSLSPTRLD